MRRLSRHGALAGAPVATTARLPSEHEQTYSDGAKHPALRHNADRIILRRCKSVGILRRRRAFERSYSGMPEVDLGEQHRLMVQCLVKRPLCDQDEVSGSFGWYSLIECGVMAMEWANGAVPTVQYTHGMIECSEFKECCSQLSTRTV